MEGKIFGVLKFPGKSDVVFHDNGKRLRVSREDPTRIVYVDLPSVGTPFTGSISVKSLPSDEFSVTPDGLVVGGTVIPFSGADPVALDYTAEKKLDVSIEQSGRQISINGVSLDEDIKIGDRTYVGKPIKTFIEKDKGNISFSVCEDGILLVESSTGARLYFAPLDDQAWITF